MLNNKLKLFLKYHLNNRTTVITIYLSKLQRDIRVSRNLNPIPETIGKKNYIQPFCIPELLTDIRTSLLKNVNKHISFLSDFFFSFFDLSNNIFLRVPHPLINEVLRMCVGKHVPKNQLHFLSVCAQTPALGGVAIRNESRWSSTPRGRISQLVEPYGRAYKRLKQLIGVALCNDRTCSVCFEKLFITTPYSNISS